MMRLGLARRLSRGGVVRLLGRARRGLPWPVLTALTYHRVADRTGGDLAAEDVVDATTSQFDEQLGWLARHHSFVTADEIVAWLGGARLPPNPVLVTFDDGYLECFTRALPLLARHGARATFFVSPRYLDERRMFWWERIDRQVRRARHDRVALSYPRRVELPVGANLEAAVTTALALVKRTPGLDLERFLDHLEERTGVPWCRSEEAAEVDRTLMTWDQVRALERAGMDVQSHTRSHRVLDTLSPAALFEELGGARRDLEERLERRVRAIAYPVGYPVDHLGHVRRALAASGYAAGFTNHTGSTWLRRGLDPFALRRVAMTRDYDGDVFPALTLLPGLAPTRGRSPVA